MERFSFESYGNFYGVYEHIGEEKTLVCVCTYKKGAVEVTKRLNELFYCVRL